MPANSYFAIHLFGHWQRSEEYHRSQSIIPSVQKCHLSQGVISSAARNLYEKKGRSERNIIGANHELSFRAQRGIYFSTQSR
jgi:hypothetical protein